MQVFAAVICLRAEMPGCAAAHYNVRKYLGKDMQMFYKKQQPVQVRGWYSSLSDVFKAKEISQKQKKQTEEGTVLCVI